MKVVGKLELVRGIVPVAAGDHVDDLEFGSLVMKSSVCTQMQDLYAKVARALIG